MSVFQNPLMNYQSSPMAQQLLALAAQARMQSAARTSEALHNIGQSIGGGMAEAGRIKLAAAMQRRKELNEAFQFGADMAMKAIMQNAAMKHERELAGEERTSRENIAREEMGTRRDIAKEETQWGRALFHRSAPVRRADSPLRYWAATLLNVAVVLLFALAAVLILRVGVLRLAGR